MVESLTMIPSKKDMENISGLLYPKKECVVRTRTGKIQTTIIFSDEERKMYNILICDDEKDIVSALKIYLKTSGYNIYEAYNGKEALEQMLHEYEGTVLFVSHDLSLIHISEPTRRS